MTLRPNQGTTLTAARDIQLPPGDTDHVLASATSSQTLTNKSISGLTNTITDVQLTGGAGQGVSGTLPIANGGTGAITKAAAFNALSPMTAAGDTIYGGTSGAGTRLAAGTAVQVLHSGTTPSWGAVSLTTDVSGLLPGANGGTGQNSTATFPTSGVVVTEAAIETLTNKIISGASNTITNVSLTAGVTGILPIANGGTSASTKAGAFDALSPMTTAGDIIYGGASGTGTRLAVGTSNQLLHGGTTPSWSTVVDADASLATKPAVAVVQTINQALTGLPTIDGVTVAANTLVLLTAQSTTSQNGPWQAQSGAWTRPTWYPAGGTTQAFQFITTLVRLGTVYQGSTWRQTAAAPITIDTTATTWVVTPLAENNNTAIAATVTKTANYTITKADNFIFCDTSGGAFTLTLPTPAAGLLFRIFDTTGNFNTNNLTLARAAAEKIEGLAASKVLQTAWGAFTIISNGTDWFVG